MLRVRLFTDEGALGALNRYSLREDAADEMGRIVALAAHAVAFAAAQEIGQLRVAIEGQTVTGQAEGILTERFSLSGGRRSQRGASVLGHEPDAVGDRGRAGGLA